MAYIEDNTPNHKTGAKIENFIFKEYKKKGLEVCRQDSNHKIPEKLKKILKSQKIIDLLELNHYDFFWIENGEIIVIEVKSISESGRPHKDPSMK